MERKNEWMNGCVQDRDWPYMNGNSDIDREKKEKEN